MLHRVLSLVMIPVAFTAIRPTWSQGAVDGLSGAGKLPCARTAIASRKLPTGPAQYESGRLRLANGAVMRLQGTPAEMSEVTRMTVGDPVAACYGPPRTYADAGPSRSITVLDLRNGAYYGTLVGSWFR